MLKIPRFKPIVLPRHVKANPGFRECKLTSHTEERRALALVLWADYRSIHAKR